MSADDDQPRNPFVRFKQHVNARIAAGAQDVAALPALLARNAAPDEVQHMHARDPGSGDSQPDTQQDGRSRQQDCHDPSSAHPVPTDFDDWAHGRREAAAAESGLGACYGGFGADRHMRRWQLFACGSRYSPLRLAAEPRQPRPRDLPDGMDPGMFTYIDAFEDLLAESAGRPMVDLQTRYDMNKLLARMWPRGEHPLSWLSRLESQGLTKAYLGHGRRRNMPAFADDWWGSRWGRTGSSWPALPPPHQDGPETHASLFGELDRAFKMLGGVLDDEPASPGRWGRPDNRPEERDQEQLPAAEDDLYSTVRSAFSDAERSLSTFIKLFSDGRPPLEPFSRDTSRPPAAGSAPDDAGASDAPAGEAQGVREDELGKTVTSKREFVDPLGNRHVRADVRTTSPDGSQVSREVRYTVEPPSAEALPGKAEPRPVAPAKVVSEDETGRVERSTAEYVDWFGNLHVKTDIRRLDRDGNELSREVYHDVGPAPRMPSAAEGGADDKDVPGRGGETRKSGWFWK